MATTKKHTARQMQNRQKDESVGLPDAYGKASTFPYAERGYTLGQTLYKVRRERNLTLRTAGAALGISIPYLHDIENDRRKPAEEILLKMAGFFKLDPDEIMALTGQLGDEAERYIRQHPVAGILLRRCAQRRLSNLELQSLINVATKLGREP